MHIWKGVLCVYEGKTNTWSTGNVHIRNKFRSNDYNRQAQIPIKNISRYTNIDLETEVIRHVKAQVSMMDKLLR